MQRVRRLLTSVWQPSWVVLGLGSRGSKILAGGGSRGLLPLLPLGVGELERGHG